MKLKLLQLPTFKRKTSFFTKLFLITNPSVAPQPRTSQNNMKHKVSYDSMLSTKPLTSQLFLLPKKVEK